MSPALLALLSLWERPVLLVPAAVVSFLLSFTALSGVTLVLVIPAICYGVAYHRRRFYPSTLTRPLLAVVLPVLACGGGRRRPGDPTRPGVLDLHGGRRGPHLHPHGMRLERRGVVAGDHACDHARLRDRVRARPPTTVRREHRSR
ncbi:MAG: hypothetical protein ACR2K0_09945 [Acidimicrobiales bacterium]